MTVKRNVILGLIFLSMFSAVPLRAEEVQSPKEESAAIAATSPSEPGMKMEEGRIKHEDMDKDKEHKHKHDMMGMGMGWIGVAMIVMMVVRVAVLF